MLLLASFFSVCCFVSVLALYLTGFSILVCICRSVCVYFMRISLVFFLALSVSLCVSLNLFGTICFCCVIFVQLVIQLYTYFLACSECRIWIWLAVKYFSVIFPSLCLFNIKSMGLLLDSLCVAFKIIIIIIINGCLAGLFSTTTMSSQGVFPLH